MPWSMGWALRTDRLQVYLAVGVTNYVRARAMSNGIAENVAIAKVAEVLEKALLAVRR